MPGLSVIVPVYKVEKYLARMIESLQNQTIRDLQIILVDDGSPDRSGAICDEYATKDDRIAVLHKQNSGVGAARNDGLDMATGEWVVFCDSDDWVEPDAFERIIAAGEKAGADVVFGDANLVFEDRVREAQFYKHEFVTDDRRRINELIAADFSRAYCFDPPEGGPAFGYGGPWNKLVRRQLLLDHNIRFDLRLKGIFDDLLYTAYIFAAARRIAYVHVPVYNYRQLGSSITHSYKDDLLQINEAIFTAWREFMDRYGTDGQFEKPFYANVLRRFKSTLGLYFFSPMNQKSFRQQCGELKALMVSEPYRTAFRELEPEGIHNSYDKLVWRAAKTGWAVPVYLVFRLSVLIKKWRK